MWDLINKANCYLNGDLTYTEGISVFIQLTKNKHLVKHLTGTYTPARERKLKYELGKITKHHEKRQKHKGSSLRSGTIQPLSSAENIISTPQKESVQTVSSAHSSNHYPNHSDRSGDHSVLEQIREERRILYRERGHQHGRLHEAISHNDRREIALRVLDIQTSINQLNKELRAAEQGKIPSRFVKKKLSADHYIRIRNLKMYISRYKKELLSISSLERKEKVEKLLAEKESELKTLL